MENSLPPAQPTIQPQPSQDVSVRVKKKTLWFVLGGIVAALFLGLGVFFFLQEANNASVAGVINYTALKPDPTDKGEVLVKYRKYGTADAYQTAFTSALADKSPWLLKGMAGQPYEMVAELVIDGKAVVASEPLIVTAPAKSQELDLRVTWQNLPQSVVSEQQTYIKGTYAINGHIPSGMQLNILAEEVGSTNTQIVASVPDVSNVGNWAWQGVTPLKDYVLHAVLIANGLQIGTTENINASGGDSQIELVINSASNPTGTTVLLTPVIPLNATSTPTTAPAQPTATKAPTPTPPPPPAPSKISGKVQINGPKDKETSLLILWRKPGQGNYQVITRINYPSVDGQTWEWDNVPVGGQYEITTALQVNEQNTATSQSQIVAAPAQNVDFTLNTGVIVDTPRDKPSLLSCNPAGNQWDATIKYPSVSKAGNYWFQIGTNPGANDSYDNKTRADGNDKNKEVTVRIDGNRSYYARYAYSICINCSNNKNFSNFADSFSFSCGGNNNNYKGYKCNPDHYACELTTDDNAPYAFNNEGLASCQAACKQPTPIPTATLAPTATPTLNPTPTPTKAPILIPTQPIGITPR